MTVEVTINNTKKGVELHFSEAPAKALANRLKQFGFKQVFNHHQKWYAPQHPAFITYAGELKESLLKQRDPLQVRLHPSFTPSEENINRRKFSYLTLSYKKDGDKKQDHYIIFDSYKAVATAIATRFGEETYKTDFIGVDVYPRNYKQKARTLLKQGKVISGTVPPEPKPAKTTPPEPDKSTKETEPLSPTSPLERSPSVDLKRVASPPKHSPLEMSPLGTTGTKDYIDLVVAHLYDTYASGGRPTKKQIEDLATELNIPNLGMLWEAAELSWLLWYKQIYNEKLPFELRLEKMIRFWNQQQPTYTYSDSSKEIYKQYSTPCPIAAMVAQYTQMDTAQHIFEPSAGNGLLLLGADPNNTHVNEIDPTRLASLRFQGFKKMTNDNAITPFPETMTKSYDVMVTNPPFSRWEEEKFDKAYIIRKYFNNHIGLSANIRLEHLMAGLALHTLKDNGKAAIIIMGHLYFSADGFIAKYRSFFNYLYRHYRVDDVINMNSFKLYNKQGAVARTMLILINGRKTVAKGVAPREYQAPYLQDIVDSFEQLWQRIKTHIGYNINTIINQLQIALTV